MKKIFKPIAAFAMIFVMAFSMAFAAVPAFADEIDETYKAGTPELSVMDGGLYTVQAGKENEIKVKLRNTSGYGAYDISVLPKYVDLDSTPFTISYPKGEGKVFNVPATGEKTLTFIVDVAEVAAAKTYGVDLVMSYFNSDDVKVEATKTIYIKVTNTTGTYSYNLEGFTSTPSSIPRGGSGTIGATLKNLSSVDMINVEIALEGLDPSGISTTGSNIIKYNKVEKGTEKKFSFNVFASASLGAGNHPVKYVITYNDELGNSYKDEYTHFVGVGGIGGETTVEIKNVAEPTGYYGVNENFVLTLDVVNTGTAEADGVVVSASEGSGAIVPKSLSKVSVGKLKAGEKKTVSFTMAATEAAKSQNYSIRITVEYDKGGTTESYDQYAGVNIENGDGGSSKPKIIVSKYESDPLIVMAGEEFDLNLSLLNTNSAKSVQNIKMFLTLSEETSSDSTKTGNIFTPVNSSNTFYFDSIAPKESVDRSIRLYTVPDAQPKTYTLTVNFEYEDSQGKEYTATELLGINVKQPTEIEIGEIYIPQSLEVGGMVSLSFELYNTGKVSLNNLMIKLDGDIDTSTKSTYYGTFDSGNTEYYDNYFSILNEGTNTFKLIVSYDDPSGEKIEDVREYTIEGIAPYIPDDMMTEPMPEENNGSAIGLIVIIVIAAAGIAIFIKKSKNEPIKKDDEQ